MKNVERFNLYTAFLFAHFYENFPIARAIDPTDIVNSLKLPPLVVAKGDPASEENKLVVHTLQWLVDTGYLIMRESGAHVRRYVLAPKALEALNATVSALEGRRAEPDEQSVGEKLADATTTFGNELASESRKQVAAQLVGQVIGHAMKAITGP